MKPFIRKSWYTLSEAAEYLTKATEGDPVTVSDILQLAVEDEISLSFHFFTEVHADAGRIRFNPELAIAHLPPEESERYLLHPARMPTNADTDCLVEYKIDDWYFFDVEEDFHVTASPGEFWELTAHGWGKELETELWRLSLETPASALNKPASWVSPRNKLPGDRSDLFPNIIPIGYTEPLPYLYLLPYPAEEEEKDAPWVIQINWSELPDDTLIGVARGVLDDLLTGQEQDTSAKPANNRNSMPSNYQELYEAVATESFPHLDLLITAWAKYWKGRSPNDGKPYPINSQVAEWVKRQMDNPMQGSNKATAIASIIRPTWAPNHRQANRDA